MCSPTLMATFCMFALGTVVAAAVELPLPTPEQLAWQKGEIMALVHFNMATFFRNGDP